MSARYMSRAIDALKTALDNNLNTEIGNVETDESLVADSIPRPTIFHARLPHLTAYNPLVYCYGERVIDDDTRNKHVLVEALVVLKFAGTSAFEADTKTIERYATAMWQTIRNNLDLDVSTGEIIEAWPVSIDMAGAVGQMDNAESLYFVAMEVHILVDEST